MDRSETTHSDPIDTLKSEHQLTLQRLEVIERTLQYLESLPSRTPDKRCRIEQTRLRDWVNELSLQIGLHFYMEEKALFPILAEYIGREHGPIEAMIIEHNNIKALISDWKHNAGELCKSTERTRDGRLNAVTSLGYKTISFLRLHISKENQILFKICETSLSLEEKSWVAQKILSIGAGQIKNFS